MSAPTARFDLKAAWATIGLQCLAVALLAACQGRTLPQPAHSPTAAVPAVATPLPSVALPAASAAQPAPSAATAADHSGLGPKAERRRRAPSVIGGCGRICSTPESAVAFLFVQLQSQRRTEDLRPLFDWSVLKVDGQDLGSRWSALWAEPHRHGERQLQIDAWISQWSTWVDHISDPTGYAAMRSRGIQLRISATDPHQALVSVRRPRLTTDPTEALWRLTWGLRGDEWLVTAIDHGSAGAQP